MKTWSIPVVWQMWATVEIEADTLAEAMEIARDSGGIIPLPDVSHYLDDSWELDLDDADDVRFYYNRGQEDD